MEDRRWWLQWAAALVLPVAYVASYGAARIGGCLVHYEHVMIDGRHAVEAPGILDRGSLVERGFAPLRWCEVRAWRGVDGWR